MTYVAGFYVATPHRSQYASDSTTRTRREGCGPTAAANGANVSTGGKVSRTGAQVHALITKAQETDPSTPGWSLVDIDRAMAKLGVGFDNRSGGGWPAVVAAWNAGLCVLIQGDSDQFSNATCSGDYDGPHAILACPSQRVVSGLRQRWIQDSICPSGRWEFEYVIHRYASKYQASIGFGVFTTKVPRAVASPPVIVALRYGGTKLSPRQLKRISVPSGRRAIVRVRPTTSAAMTKSKPSTYANGSIFTSYQVTKTGQLLAGSRKWYGDRTGTRWLHVTAF